jgi:hypothetical protein
MQTPFVLLDVWSFFIFGKGADCAAPIGGVENGYEGSYNANKI